MPSFAFFQVLSDFFEFFPVLSYVFRYFLILSHVFKLQPRSLRTVNLTTRLDYSWMTPLVRTVQSLELQTVRKELLKDSTSK